MSLDNRTKQKQLADNERDISIDLSAPLDPQNQTPDRPLSRSLLFAINLAHSGQGGGSIGTADILEYLNGLSVSAWNDLTNFTGAVQNWWDESLDGVIAFLRDLDEDARNAIDAFVSWLGTDTDIIDKIWEALKSSYSWLEDTITDVAENIWEALKLSYTWLEDAIADVAGNIWESLKLSYTWLEDSIADLAGNIWEALKSSYSWLEDAISDVADSIWTDLKSSYSWLEDAISDVAGNVWESLKSSYTWLEDAIADVAGNVWGSLKSSYSWLEDAIADVAGNVWGALKSSYTWLEDAIADVAGNVWGALKSSYTWLEDAIADVAGNVWGSLKSSYSWLEDEISDVVDNITSQLGTTWTNITTALSGITTSLSLWIQGRGSDIQTALGTNWNKLTSIISAFTFNSANAITAISGGLSTAVTSAVSDAVDDIEAGVQTAIDWVADATTNIQSWWDDNTDSGIVWLQGLTSTVQNRITSAATWVVSATSNIETAISSAGTEIRSALGSNWSKLTDIINQFTFSGNTVNGIRDALDSAVDTIADAIPQISSAISTWLNTTLGTTGRSTLAAVSSWLGSTINTSSEIIDRILDQIIGGTSGSFINRFYKLVSSSATSLKNSFERLLFGGLIPSAFAESEADGQITASISSTSSGSIGGKINTALNDILTAAGEATQSTLASITTAIGNLFSSSSTSGANTNLSNLGSNVAINKPLTFGSSINTSGTDGTKSIGYDTNGNLWLKTKSTGNDLRFTAGGVTFFRVHGRSIYLQSGTSDPMTNGEIRMVGDTIKVKVNDGVKDLVDIGTGDGGTTTVSSGFTTLTSNQQDAGAFWVPVGIGTITSTTTQLDTLFGSAAGSIGILRPATMGGSSHGSVYFVWKTSAINNFSAWLGIPFAGTLAASTTGSRSTDLTYTKKSLRIASGPSSIPSPTTTGVSSPATGDWGIHVESDDFDDGAIWIYENTALLFEQRIRDFGTSTSSGTTNTAVPNRLPVINSAGTSSALESIFGIDDGYVGYIPSSNRFYAKVGGYWLYRAF